PATPEPSPVDASSISNAELSASLEALQTVSRLDFKARKQLLISVLGLLKSDDEKTPFAQSGCFLAYISLLASLELPPDATDDTQADERLQVVRLILETLARSFQEQRGNREVFAQTVGFSAI